MTIEGIPEGWELVRVGVPDGDDWLIGHDGNPVAQANLKRQLRLRQYAIIRKIPKPKQYRAFANAAEFKPHRDRWTMHPNEPDKRFRSGDYDDDGAWGINGRFYDYAHLFESGALFEDGTPFGVEVAS